MSLTASSFAESVTLTETSNPSSTAERGGQPMEKSPEITPVQILAETQEEVKEAPSRLRKILREFEAMWGRTATQFFEVPKN
jgi:hypothetical protein